MTVTAGQSAADSAAGKGAARQGGWWQYLRQPGDVVQSLMWIPRLPRGWFTPGWFLFCLRIWLSVILALVLAFWLQFSSPGTAAVTVMILAQPLRGQILSKSLYRLLGTLVGAVVAILLTSLFSQDRSVLLGAIGLWLAGCSVVGSVNRDFRAYGALLAGYTVAIISIGGIDAPARIFDVTINRVSAIALGIAVTAALSIAFSSPTAAGRLTELLSALADRVHKVAANALAGRSTPDATTTVGISRSVIALTTELSYAQTELQDARIRLAGARSAMVSMLEILTSSRSVARALERGLVATPVVEAVREVFAGYAEEADSRAAMDRLEAIARDAPGDGLTLESAWFIEQAMMLLAHERWTSDGISAVRSGRGAGVTPPVFPVAVHEDVVLALLNGGRLLIGYSMMAWLCIWSGIPESFMALSQLCVILTLAATTYDVIGFGAGNVIGTVMSVIIGGIFRYYLYPLGEGVEWLALVTIFPVFLSCILMMNAKTKSAGFIFGVFYFATMGVSNTETYDPVSFVDRNMQYIFSGVMIFISLVLLLPPKARARRMRVAMGIALELKAQMREGGHQAASWLISRSYDRAGHFMNWSSYLPETKSRTRVLERFVAFAALNGALARARRHLDRAAAIPGLGEAAREARAALLISDPHCPAARLRRTAEDFLRASGPLPRGQMTTALRAVSGMCAAVLLLESNASALRHYRIIPEETDWFRATRWWVR
ncbi:FUSC family protein [Acetobacter sp. AN02]|uniref:FUSC family protein n=1 Tax=Acetobacter sp. AN02 TaxID=2894186 RepID=UPI0024342827|nr:FUSC family protein [Acetobacter sp. AN02]MDG6093835.1 FUSC family protein [Acetobacter sp. AN02]